MPVANSKRSRAHRYDYSRVILHRRIAKPRLILRQRFTILA
jgi:hypothetical protein